MNKINVNDLNFKNLDKFINTNKLIPENILSDRFSYLVFLSFDDVFLEDFFVNLSKFLKIKNEAWLMVYGIRTYRGFNPFVKRNTILGAFSICADTNSAEKYLEAIWCIPDELGSYQILADAIVYFSNCASWTIYAERDSNIAICGFSDKRDARIFKQTFGELAIFNPSEAAEISDYYYHPDKNKYRKFIEEFRKNYESFRIL